MLMFFLYFCVNIFSPIHALPHAVMPFRHKIRGTSDIGNDARLNIHRAMCKNSMSMKMPQATITVLLKWHFYKSKEALSPLQSGTL